MEAKSRIEVTGASDDLIEFEGAIVDEFNSPNRPLYIMLNDGTLIKAFYDDAGIWRISVEKKGKADYSRTIFSLPLGLEVDEVEGGATDKLTVWWDNDLKVAWTTDEPKLLTKMSAKVAKLAADPASQKEEFAELVEEARQKANDSGDDADNEFYIRLSTLKEVIFQ